MDASLLLMMTAFHAARASAARISAVRPAAAAWRPPAPRRHGGGIRGLMRRAAAVGGSFLHECQAGAARAGAVIAVARPPAWRSRTARVARSGWIRALDEVGLVPHGHLRAD